MVDIASCKDIHDFYRQSSMNRQEAFIFLLTELDKIKRSDKHEK